ncbi:chemotaxis protein CheA [Halioglobus japonicus]|uniref:Chemotaxis protein CheA n=1 Tax=Halioglobus japonicus TaxID=930805 RepID=A0AAP8ME33_9GAMM|nr:chemotaxis protein CheA [Halioglobus japonicus]AQA18112.1 chemotaxis protein CheA [Halioglobus japonicus]PLW86106.1 chemotaxis protein CheA [Halioglobus japonicus]GHD14446.1 chemotaxis protein CheA [Halioglobus japonicus]
MDLSEFSKHFFDEADELLSEIECCLLNLDLEHPDSETLNAVFRAAHSIKGGAGTFGFTVVQETTHILENLLDDARNGKLILTRVIVDQILEARDMLKDQLDAYKNGTAPDQANFDALCRALQRVAEENRTDFGPISAVQGGSANPNPSTAGENSSDFELFNEAELPSSRSPAQVLLVQLNSVNECDRALIIEELGNLGDVLSQSGDAELYDIIVSTNELCEDLAAVLNFVIEPEQLTIIVQATSDANGSADVPIAGPKADHAQVDSNVDAQDSANSEKQAKRSSSESTTIRVAVDKLDQVINLVGELIITQSMLNETANSLEGVTNSELLNGINLLQRNARDLQEAVMSIRMLPMDYVFSRFPRLVRDFAGKLGKEINLVTEGESTELDKGLTERIIDPLTHLVRNSLDHGIELPEVREAAGKSREGRLVLSAQHEGGNIVIEVRDDGLGLDRDKILAKAKERGIGLAENPSDQDVWQLVFTPGFSTAAEVSDISGRGVGMDVVKRNIQSMGGYVEIESERGKGTTTRIVLPLTLAILDGMLVRGGSEIYILPVSSIIESLQLQDENLSSLPGNIPMLRVREEYYPVVAIYDAMGLQDTREERDSDERKTAVMLQAGSLKYVLLVDELIGQQQVVVKNLEDNYGRVEGVSAATILGDGSVALILDIGDLYRLGQESRLSTQRTATKKVNPADSTEQQALPADD